jgi:uncharacterized protein
MKRVLLMHGKDTSPQEKWYPWLTRELAKHNIFCHVPALANAHDPDIQEWKQAVKEFSPDKDSILVGHSRGGVAILRYL